MSRPARVLIIDDREIVRDTLRNILNGFICQFYEAKDGASALDLLRTAEFDVIFLDLILPDVSGTEILRKARTFQNELGKVIVLTGFPEATTQEQAADFGVFKYLTKNPIDHIQVRAAFTDAISALGFQMPAAEQPKKRTGSPKGAQPRGQRRTRSKKEKSRNNSHPRLLVLDDKQYWLDTVQLVLGKDFDIIPMTDPDTATRRAAKENFDLIVVDLKLSDGISGLDVLSQMRRANPTLRAIVLTGYPDYETAVQAGQRGALNYVYKGELGSLKDTITKVLSENVQATRIFLSYTKTDHTKVAHLFDKLMQYGFLPWMDDKSILGGTAWESAIQKAIEECDYFVYCVSRHSQEKEGVIRKEAKWALKRQEGLLDSTNFIIPLRLESCEVIEPFDKYQYVDLFKSDGFTMLLRTLSSKSTSAK